MGDSKKSTRRSFINALIGGGLIGWMGTLFYPVLTFLKPPKEAEATVNSVKAGAIADFPVGSGQIIKYGRTPVLLVHSEDGSFKAFSATCTHLDCIVQYKPELKHIWCACHNGQYDMQGRNISGPPPRPLTPYKVNIVDDQVIVSKDQAVA